MHALGDPLLKELLLQSSRQFPKQQTHVLSDQGLKPSKRAKENYPWTY
jgi:hypothetical protein